VTHYTNEELPAVRAVPWTLRDCLWASVPTLLFAALGVFLHFEAPRPSAQLLVNPGVLIASSVLTSGLLLGPVYIIAIRKRGARLADLGFVRAPAWDSTRLIAAAFLMDTGVSTWWARIARHFGIALQPDGLDQFGTGMKGFVLAMVLGAIVAPVVEEMFFRGFLFGAIRKNHSFWIAAASSGLIFGAAHLVPGAIVSLSAAGFLWAWLRERTGSMWPCIAAHVLNNALYYATHFAVHHLQHS
jgi:membrane protease YdiL (CAAX protease family)